MHLQDMKKSHAKYLFESNRKKKYTDRAVRYILNKYSKKSSNGSANISSRIKTFLVHLVKNKILMMLLFSHSRVTKAENPLKYNLNYQLLRLKIVTIILLINFLYKICWVTKKSDFAVF